MAIGAQSTPPQKLNHDPRSQTRVVPTHANWNVVATSLRVTFMGNGHEYAVGADSASSTMPVHSSSPMSVDSPPVSKVYQDQMTTLSHGLALWNPNPPKETYDKVTIGDVGYLYDGSFIRMFNVILPWSHESNRTLGQPEPYEPLDCGPLTDTLKRQFDRVKHYSRYVSAERNAGNRQAMTPHE